MMSTTTRHTHTDDDVEDTHKHTTTMTCVVVSQLSSSSRRAHTHTHTRRHAYAATTSKTSTHTHRDPSDFLYTPQHQPSPNILSSGYTLRVMHPGYKAHIQLVPRPRMVELYFTSKHIFMEWCLISQAQGKLYIFMDLLEKESLLKGDTIWPSRSSPMFWRNIPPPYSVMSKKSRKQSESSTEQCYKYEPWTDQ
jgi:hypothetical protein